jgi:hypothetical protein
MSGSVVTQPVDSRGNVIRRSMGAPKVIDSLVLVSATNYVDVFDLSGPAFKNRVFTGMSIKNLSANSNIEVAFGEDFASVKNVVCGTAEYLVLDDLMFGPSVRDEDTQQETLKVRAKLSVASGNGASGTITYVANPANENRVEINGIIYEFSNDASSSPTLSDYLVAIGATADDSWNNLVLKINEVDQAIRASFAVGTVTITSVAGGAAANAITIADGVSPTGATFSGATLSGALGGVTPVFHIW